MEELKKGLAAFHLECTETVCSQFSLYEQLLLAWNEKMNLTAITEHSEILNKHFIDSLSCHALLPTGAKVVDVGTGAGFPGIPLKIVRPDLTVTLMDSLQKRLTFLDTVCESLSLSGIETVHMRAEDAGQSLVHRECYDVSLARAVAPLPVLCEYCMPLVKPGGVFLALKGRDGGMEAEKAEKAIKILGGELMEIRDVSWRDMEHVVVCIRKVRPTPSKYPRKAGKPKNSPISC